MKRDRPDELPADSKADDRRGRRRHKAQSPSGSHDTAQESIRDDAAVLWRKRPARPINAVAERRPNLEEVSDQRAAFDCSREAPPGYESAISAICDMNKEILDDYCRRLAVRFGGPRLATREKSVRKNGKRST